MHDVLVKAWAMWGDYLENIFVKERQPQLGVSAITCYLHACRHQNESKSRKYLAKVRPLPLSLFQPFYICVLVLPDYSITLIGSWPTVPLWGTCGTLCQNGALQNMKEQEQKEKGGGRV